MTPSVQDIAAVATALGAVVAGWQLWLVQRQAVTQFEDQMSTQYRQLMRDMPVDALLGKPLAHTELQDRLSVFYHYFDLCNEQAFLHKHGPIRSETWKEWKEGICQNLGRPAFANAWSLIADSATDSFDELRKIYPPRPLAAAVSIPPGAVPSLPLNRTDAARR